MSSITPPDDDLAGQWILSTPALTMTAVRGESLPVRVGPGQFAALAATAEAALRAGPEDTAVVGVLPFDESTPAHLLLARVEHHRHRPRDRADTVRALVAAQPPDLFTGTAIRPPRSEPSPEVYLQAVREALARIRAGSVHKVVLARSLYVPLHGEQLRPALLHTLTHREPTGHLFRTPLPPTQPQSPQPLLIGSTPETLLRRTGDLLTLTPLAGTTARHPDPGEDRARAAALLRSSKDHTEHRHVIDALRRQLRPWCHSLDIPPEPRLHATGRLWHLATPIRARLRHPAPSALALAAALHPTPAVCGSPTHEAAALIRELESVPRRYFSGLVGWMDRTGDGHWVIALRCGELNPSGIRLHAGAGIVSTSDPEAELAETEAQFTTMLDALKAARTAEPAARPASSPTGAPR
jgi:isochorismate synthase